MSFFVLTIEHERHVIVPSGAISVSSDSNKPARECISTILARQSMKLTTSHNASANDWIGMDRVHFSSIPSATPENKEHITKLFWFC